MSFELSLDEGSFLVKLARKTIMDFLETKRKPSIPKNIPAKLKKKCGVFITLHSIKNGVKKLRGCIGYPMPESSIVEATIDSAINSATHDPRFPPVVSQEMRNIVVEISILTPPALIVVKDPREYLKKVIVGRDGLIVERGWSRGLLLPQVPVEWEWDVEEYLNNCCLKAGLTPDSWLIRETKIYRFSCVIAKELNPRGKVIVEVLK